MAKNIHKNHNALLVWEQATHRLAYYFSDFYFGEEADTYWVGDEVGGVFSINDYFFNPNTMYEYLRYGYSKKKMFEHYEYTLGCVYTGESPMNIKTWIKLKK